jgi:glucan 1,3-beta-glucosidase
MNNLNTNCIAAFASMRVTARAAYLLMENVWLWVADRKNSWLLSA